MEKEEVLKNFKFHGDWASFHYADNTGQEWPLGQEEERKAVAIFHLHPEYQDEMREIAKDFLWKIGGGK